MGGAEPTSAVATALVAHAARDGMGEAPPWEDVVAGLRRLRDDPSGADHLGKALRELNDREPVAIIRSWCIRLLEIDEGAARDANRTASVLMQPVQAGFFGLAGAVTLALAIGTLNPVAGAILLGATTGAAGSATYGRWKLSRVEDGRKQDAERTRRLLAALKD